MDVRYNSIMKKSPLFQSTAELAKNNSNLNSNGKQRYFSLKLIFQPALTKRKNENKIHRNVILKYTMFWGSYYGNSISPPVHNFLCKIKTRQAQHLAPYNLAFHRET